jgi:cobalt-zinc-cadmium resistance protein CzcA
LIGGGAVTQVFVGDRVYDVTVRFPLDARNNPEALGNLTVSNSSGMQIPLPQLVTTPFWIRLVMSDTLMP